MCQRWIHFNERKNNVSPLLSPCNDSQHASLLYTTMHWTHRLFFTKPRSKILTIGVFSNNWSDTDTWPGLDLSKLRLQLERWEFKPMRGWDPWPATNHRRECNPEFLRHQQVVSNRSVSYIPTITNINMSNLRLELIDFKLSSQVQHLPHV